MQNLSEDELFEIFTYLEAKEIVSISKVCKTWSIVAHEKRLWQYIDISKFGVDFLFYLVQEGFSPTHIVLNDCQFLTNSFFVKAFSKFGNLQSLTITKCPLTDAAFQGITDSLKLRELHISEISISGKILCNFLFHCKDTLEALTIKDMISKVNISHVYYKIEKPNMEMIKRKMKPNISMITFPKMKSVHCQIPRDISLFYKAFPSLTSLDLYGNFQNIDKFLELDWSQIQTLKLNYCSLLMDENQVKRFIKTFKNVKYLHLLNGLNWSTYCPRTITKPECIGLFFQLEHLKVLKLGIRIDGKYWVQNGFWNRNNREHAEKWEGEYPKVLCMHLEELNLCTLNIKDEVMMYIIESLASFNSLRKVELIGFKENVEKYVKLLFKTQTHLENVEAAFGDLGYYEKRRASYTPHSTKYISVVDSYY